MRLRDDARGAEAAVDAAVLARIDDEEIALMPAEVWNIAGDKIVYAISLVVGLEVHGEIRAKRCSENVCSHGWGWEHLEGFENGVPSRG